jgi:hypothetical protein
LEEGKETMGSAISTIAAAVTSAAALLYLGLVLAVYRHEGRAFRMRWALRDPSRSALYLLVWLGVRVVDALDRFFRRTFDILYDASADVGEWYLRRRGRPI